MKVELSQTVLADVNADLIAVGLFQGESLPGKLSDARGAGDAKGSFKSVSVIHPDPPQRVIVIGLGKRDEFDAEKARVAGALAAKAAAGKRSKALTIGVPDVEEATGVAAALVEGAILASYRFDRFHATPEDPDAVPVALEELTVLAPAEASDAVRVATVATVAANRAREHQNLPSNVATPSYLAERAQEIAREHSSVTVEALDRSEISRRGMGGLEAVSKGTAEEPWLISLSYSGGGEGADTLGLIGKAVTFDTGGISIKPSGSMHEMKMDMSGGAAVLEAFAAIAELELPVNILAVVPTTENMPSGTAVKPGDIITQLNGKTVEVNNTDAEGRLILADALAYAVEQGADQLIDLATLTGAVVIALGSTYAALISNDDELAASVAAAGERTGELAWRLPLHAEYKELTKGTVADLTNASAKRKAGTIYAASFLEEFVDGKPWVHLDIAGTAWDVGREYVGKGPTGYGVRLLVDLVRSQAG